MYLFCIGIAFQFLLKCDGFFILSYIPIYQKKIHRTDLPLLNISMCYFCLHLLHNYMCMCCLFTLILPLIVGLFVTLFLRNYNSYLR